LLPLPLHGPFLTLAPYSAPLSSSFFVDLTLFKPTITFEEFLTAMFPEVALVYEFANLAVKDDLSNFGRIVEGLSYRFLIFGEGFYF
jgi:hypothetical protein